MLKGCIGNWVPDTERLVRFAASRGHRDAEELLRQLNRFD
jgi:hypothetical protein